MADLLPKVTCTYCQEDVNGVRVQCCECPDFDICLQCFAAGAEIGPHRNDHSYKFVDQGSVSVFGGRGSWTGQEHLKLLEAAELYSYSNWDLVAEAVKTRTAEECREEYTARYLDGNIGKAMWQNIPKPNLFINLGEDEGPLSPLALAKLAPLDATLEESRLLGYKPHRDDFEREYNPEAEQLIANLPLEESDETAIEKALKLSVVDMYVRRLRERQRRKRIVRDYQLVAKYFDTLRRDPSQPLYPKDQKELRDHMRTFAQFLNSGEEDRLVASVERERELRHRLSELMRYRGLGLTTQEEIIHYEQHVAYTKQQIRAGKVGSVGSATQPIQSTNPYLTFESGDGETASSSTDAKIMWLSGSDLEYDSGAAGLAGLGAQAQLDDYPMMTSAVAPTSIWTAQTSLSPSTKSSAGIVELAAAPASEHLKAMPMGKWLSQGELQLCVNLNMQPVTYVTLKSLIIQDNLLDPGKYQDVITKEDPEPTVKDEVTRFLGLNGWLPGGISTK